MWRNIFTCLYVEQKIPMIIPVTTYNNRRRGMATGEMNTIVMFQFQSYPIAMGEFRESTVTNVLVPFSKLQA